ncbi:hypothetical protein [Streptomyces sp. LARHCF252]
MEARASVAVRSIPARTGSRPCDRLDVVRLVALGRTNAEIAAWAWQNGHARAGA